MYLYDSAVELCDCLSVVLHTLLNGRFMIFNPIIIRYWPSHTESRSKDWVLCPGMLQWSRSSTVLENICIRLFDHTAPDTGDNVGISDKKSYSQELERFYLCCSQCLHFEHCDSHVHSHHIVLQIRSYLNAYRVIFATGIFILTTFLMFTFFPKV